jgi:MFS transporter, ACS family, glucarate transporter
MWACSRWGAAATPPLLLVGIQLFGWRWSFVGFGLLGVVWVTIFLAWFRENPADNPKVNAAERELLQDAQTLVTHQEGGWLAILTQPQTLLLMFQYFCWSYIWYFFVTWMPTYLQEAHGQSLAATAGLSILPLLAGGFGSLISGLLPLSFPRQKVAIGCFVAVAVLLFALTRVQSVGLAVALMAAISFAGDVTVPISWNSCVEIGKRYTATVAAAMNMFANFSGFIAPWIGGIILKRSGNDWNEVLTINIVLACVGAVLWLFIDPTGRRAARAQPLEPAPALEP